MKWYCEHLSGRHANLAAECVFRDREISEGAALTTNAGKVGAWYFDDEIDTRPVTCFGWKETKAYSCNCKCESDCPVRKARQREIDDFIDTVIQQGLDFAWHIWSELYHYIMTKNNPSGVVYPQDIQLPYEYATEAETLLHERLLKVKTYGHFTNNNRQPT